MSQEVCIVCSIHSFLFSSPSSPGLRKFEQSSHPTPTSRFQAKLSPFGEAEAQPHKNACLW